MKPTRRPQTLKKKSARPETAEAVSVATKKRRRKLTPPDIKLLLDTAARMINRSGGQKFIPIKKLSEALGERDGDVEESGIGRGSIHYFLKSERTGDEKAAETLFRLIVTHFLEVIRESLERTIHILDPATMSPIERILPIFKNLTFHCLQDIESARVVLQHVSFRTNAPPVSPIEREVSSITSLIDEVISEARDKSELTDEVREFEVSLIRNMLVDTVLNVLRDILLTDKKLEEPHLHEAQILVLRQLQIFTEPKRARKRLEAVIKLIRQQRSG